jgi:putative addiction module killer protein
MEYEIEKTGIFKKWFVRLKDRQVKTRLAVRFDQIRLGNFGDHKNFSGGISELRFDFGPGWLIYYTIRDNRVVLLLTGGDKSTQDTDIQRAYAIIKKMEE